MNKFCISEESEKLRAEIKLDMQCGRVLLKLTDIYLQDNIACPNHELRCRCLTGEYNDSTTAIFSFCYIFFPVIYTMLSLLKYAQFTQIYGAIICDFCIYTTIISQNCNCSIHKLVKFRKSNYSKMIVKTRLKLWFSL